MSRSVLTGVYDYKIHEHVVLLHHILHIIFNIDYIFMKGSMTRETIIKYFKQRNIVYTIFNLR